MQLFLVEHVKHEQLSVCLGFDKHCVGIDFTDRLPNELNGFYSLSESSTFPRVLNRARGSSPNDFMNQ